MSEEKKPILEVIRDFRKLLQDNKDKINNWPPEKIAEFQKAINQMDPAHPDFIGNE